jgi:hypothetical protein
MLQLGEETMTKNRSIIANANRSWGDIAIDGLWPGLVGGSLMIAYLVAAGLFTGIQPLAVFAAFLPDTALPPITGVGTHLAVSAVHGTVFGLLTAVINHHIPNRLPLWLAGMLYGLILWLAASLVIIPTGVSGLGTIPSGHLLAAHLLYGWGMGRMLANNRP